MVFLIFVLVGTATAVWVTSRRPESTELERDRPQQSQDPRTLPQLPPEARWEPIFFKIINERTAESRIPELRTVLIDGNDFEVRVWVGFGINGEDGLILRHSSNQWSAVHLHGMSERPPVVRSVRNLDAPQSGWEIAWQRLTEAAILTLPDALVAGCNTHRFDGVTYVVEISKNKSYRTYMYDNPHRSPCDEAKQMLRIGEIIAEEFNLKGFKIEG